MSTVGFNPNASVPVSQDTSQIIKQMESSSSITVKSLGAYADSVTASGSLTEEQKTTLEITAQLQLSDPTLSPTDKALVQDFIDSLASMPYAPGGAPSIQVGNAWLNVTAFVAVIQLIFQITSELSQIKLSEAQMQILMTRVAAEMAKNIATIVENTGQLQAEMRMNEAYKSMIQAGMALTSMVMTGMTQVARNVKIFNAEERFKSDPINRGRSPTLEEKARIAQTVDAELAMTRQFSESLPQCINALTNASTEAKNAALEILKAQSEAASGQLSKLADLLKGTIDTLRGDQSDLSQTIAKLLDNFLSAFSRQRVHD